MVPQLLKKGLHTIGIKDHSYNFYPWSLIGTDEKLIIIN